MRFWFFCVLFVSLLYCKAYAQHDSFTPKTADGVNPPSGQSVEIPMIDSATLARREQFRADSIAMVYLAPDSNRETRFLTKLFENKIPGIYNYTSSLIADSTHKAGQPRKLRAAWMISTIVFLLIYAALLNLLLSKDLKVVIQSFYYKQALSQPNKEGGPINLWAFIGLFLLFSLTFGLVLCQLAGYHNLYYGMSDFQLFLLLSAGIILLFALKFLVLKFLGFVFDMSRVVSEYITILNLTYFNIAFVFLIVAICFSLLAERFIPYLLVSTLVLIAVIFTWQYVRNSVNIISNFRFHKFYLIIYLCALEICPVLILIKALNINF